MEQQFKAGDHVRVLTFDEAWAAKAGEWKTDLETGELLLYGQTCADWDEDLAYNPQFIILRLDGEDDTAWARIRSLSGDEDWYLPVSILRHVDKPLIDILF